MFKSKFEPFVLSDNKPVIVIDVAAIERAKHISQLRKQARADKWEYIKYKMTIYAITLIGVCLLLAMGCGLMLLSRALPY